MAVKNGGEKILSNISKNNDIPKVSIIEYYGIIWRVKGTECIKIQSNENLGQKLRVIVESIFCCGQDAKREIVSFKLWSVGHVNCICKSRGRVIEMEKENFFPDFKVTLYFSNISHGYPYFPNI